MPDGSDLERSIHQSETLERIVEKLALIERRQVVSLRHLRRTPDLTATAMVKAIGKRSLFLIGIGIAIGSALGGAGVQIARDLIVRAFHAGGP